MQQLNEDDSIQGSDKENNDSIDDVDGILVHQEKRKSQRDTHCSMLTDIEKTLADLHVNENLTGSTDTSPAEDKSRLSGQAHQDNRKDKASSRKQTGPEANNVSQSELNTTSQHPTVTSEVKTQPILGQESPKVIPTAKPRKIPKASHKPSPKPRSKLEHQDDCTTESTVLEKLSEDQENKERTANNTRRSETIPQVKFLPQPANSEKRITQAGLLPKATNSSKNIVSDNKTVTNNDKTHTQPNHDTAIPTSPGLRENKKCVDKTNSPTTSSSSEESSDTAGTTENHTKDRKRLKDTVATNSKGMNRKKDSQLGNKEKSENHTTNEETGNTTKGEAIQADTLRSTMTNSDNQPARVSRQTSSDGEASPSQHGDSGRGRSEETRKQTRESNEDQTGKGKTSKIPVRAGYTFMHTLLVKIVVNCI